MSDDLYDGPCEAGCKSFHGGERKHHKDCGYYPHSLTKVNEDRIEELERERDELRGFDDYFRLLCGLKRDGRNSKECLDDFISGLKRQDVIVPFDHFLKVAEDQNIAQAKLAQAVGVLRKIAAYTHIGMHEQGIVQNAEARIASTALAELEKQ